METARVIEEAHAQARFRNHVQVLNPAIPWQQDGHSASAGDGSSCKTHSTRRVSCTHVWPSSHGCRIVPSCLIKSGFDTVYRWPAFHALVRMSTMNMPSSRSNHRIGVNSKRS